MKFSNCSTAVIAAVIVSIPVSAAHAQAEPEAEQLPEAVAEDDRIDDSYVIGTGNESGTSKIERGEIEARTPGSGDVNQLLKAFPTVQFDRNEGLARRDEIQDIRPADISISGGRIYENLITIDGIDVNSRFDTTNANPANFNEVAGASAQTVWFDAELIGAITLRDSNVSAEYGRFTGGSLDIETRQANRSWGASATVNYTEDGLVNYLISDRSLAAFEASGEELPEAPEFRKWRFGATLDVPVSDRGGLLLAVNRSTSEVLTPFGSRSLLEPQIRRSESNNFLISGNYDLNSELTLSGQVSYSPYESEYANPNGGFNELVSYGGGLVSKVNLAARGDAFNWDVTASYSHSDTSREAQPIHYIIPSTSPNGNYCTSTNCSRGGFGDLDQTQDNYGLKLKMWGDLGAGELSGGFDFQILDLLKERPEESRAYLTVRTGSDIVCTSGESLDCSSGEYYHERYNVYQPYLADINLKSFAAWAQYDVALGPIDLRAGLRYDYEDFLGNGNFGPRLSVSWNINDDWAITAGANRYYGRSMVAYAVRDAYPNLLRYRRLANNVGGERQIGDNDWFLERELALTKYRNADLDTPYSDELTGAVTGSVFGGVLRLKGIYRDGRDGFARSLREREIITLPSGGTTTRSVFELTNDGRNEYWGGSLEYVKTFGNHTFSVNVNYSETTSNNDDYFATAFDIAETGEQVLFNGQIVDLIEVLEQNQQLEFASPFIVNASWTAQWFNNRLTTNVNARYRDGFERIEDTGINETVDGTRYDVYDFIVYPTRVNFDLNAQFDIIDQPFGSLTADMRVSNLLNTIPAKNSASVSQPYQFGRSVWVGLKYKY